MRIPVSQVYGMSYTPSVTPQAGRDEGKSTSYLRAARGLGTPSMPCVEISPSYEKMTNTVYNKK